MLPVSNGSLRRTPPRSRGRHNTSMKHGSSANDSATEWLRKRQYFSRLIFQYSASGACVRLSILIKSSNYKNTPIRYHFFPSYPYVNFNRSSHDTTHHSLPARCTVLEERSPTLPTTDNWKDEDALPPARNCDAWKWV